jgi:hypothetical protein
VLFEVSPGVICVSSINKNCLNLSIQFIYKNKKPGFSDAGKPGNPTALSSHPHWCGFYICNCLFTTLVTRVGYLLLHYSAPIEPISAP